MVRIRIAEHVFTSRKRDVIRMGAGLIFYDITQKSWIELGQNAAANAKIEPIEDINGGKQDAE